MSDSWQPQETSTHQDHVIAHVIGATVAGYFTWDEALHVLLDIGFIWTIYVDGEMGLLPHPVAVNELEVQEDMRTQIKDDIELLLRDRSIARGLHYVTTCPVDCLIEDVTFFGNGDERRLLVSGEEANLVIVTSLTTKEVRIAQG